jgi:hypothetical protein
MQTPRAHRTTELIKELSSRGYSITVYAVLGKYDYQSFENKYNVKIKNIDIYFQNHPYNSDSDGKRKLIDKVLGNLLGKIAEFPNIEFLFRIVKIIKVEPKHDVLLTIADPHQIHWGAAKAKRNLKDKFPNTWIADCGDPFMENGRSKDHFKYFSYFEKKFCERCDFITVPVEEAVAGYYKEYQRKIKIIPQGFSFEFKEEKSNPKNSIVTFAFAGTFYQGIRNPTAFLNFLSGLDIDFLFVIYTRYTDLIDPFKEILADKIEIREPIDREDLMKELEKMDFLLNIENTETTTQIPSKLIDYGIAGRPILSVNPEKFEHSKVLDFLSRNYQQKLEVQDLDKYHISNVTDKFVDLFNQKN